VVEMDFKITKWVMFIAEMFNNDSVVVMGRGVQEKHKLIYELSSRIINEDELMGEDRLFKKSKVAFYFIGSGVIDYMVVGRIRDILDADGCLVLVGGNQRSNQSFRELASGMLSAVSRFLVVCQELGGFSEIKEKLKAIGFSSTNLYIALPSHDSTELVFDIRLSGTIRRGLSIYLDGKRSLIIYWLAKLFALLSSIKRELEGCLYVRSGAGYLICAESGSAKGLWSQIENSIQNKGNIEIKSACLTSEKIIFLAGKKNEGNIVGLFKYSHLKRSARGREESNNPFKLEDERTSVGSLRFHWDNWIKGKALSANDRTTVTTVFSYLKDLQNSRRMYMQDEARILEYFIHDHEIRSWGIYSIDVIHAMRCALQELKFDLSSRLNFVPEHGDLVATNIIKCKDGSIEVVDSESWNSRGFELFDPITLYISFLSGEPKRSDSDHFRKSLENEKNWIWMERTICDLYDLTYGDLHYYIFLCLVRKSSIHHKEGRARLAEYWATLASYYFENKLLKV